MLLLFAYARTIYKQISEIPKTETLVQQWPLTSLRSLNWSSSVKHTKKFSTEFHPQKESKRNEQSRKGERYEMRGRQMKLFQEEERKIRELSCTERK